MPELPEVETVRRGLSPVMEGVVISSVEMRRPDLRFAMPERFVERLSGQSVPEILLVRDAIQPLHQSTNSLYTVPVV